MLNPKPKRAGGHHALVTPIRIRFAVPFPEALPLKVRSKAMKQLTNVAAKIELLRKGSAARQAFALTGRWLIVGNWRLQYWMADDELIVEEALFLGA